MTQQTRKGVVGSRRVGGLPEREARYNVVSAPQLFGAENPAVTFCPGETQSATLRPATGSSRFGGVG